MKKITILYDFNIMADAFYSSSSRSGVFRVAWELFKALLKRKDVCVVVFCNFGILYKLQKYLENFGFKNLNYAVVEDQRPSLRRVRSFSRWILSRLKLFFSSKILFAKNVECDYFFTASLWQYKKVEINSNPQIFAFAHDVMPLVFPQYYPGEEWRSKFEAFDNYFANSAYTKADFLKHLPHLKPENIIVSPLACDERFKPANADEIAKAKAKYKIPSDKKYIFSLCTLEPRKNLIRAVKCFANFISKNNIDDLVFVLGGAHWDRFISILENEIGSLDENIKSRILKIGYVDDSDQAALYSGALFFVYTSQYEGFGLPPLEAMSCGTPVITSNNSSLPEVVGDAGIMIDYDDDEAHIKAYESYYYNENLRKENSKKGLERAKLFSWEKCADIMITEMKKRAGL